MFPKSVTSVYRVVWALFAVADFMSHGLAIPHRNVGDEDPARLAPARLVLPP